MTEAAIPPLIAEINFTRPNELHRVSEIPSRLSERMMKTGGASTEYFIRAFITHTDPSTWIAVGDENDPVELLGIVIGDNGVTATAMSIGRNGNPRQGAYGETGSVLRVIRSYRYDDLTITAVAEASQDVGDPMTRRFEVAMQAQDPEPIVTTVGGVAHFTHEPFDPRYIKRLSDIIAQSTAPIE